MKRPGLIRGLLVIGILYAASGMVHRLNVHSCAHTQVRVKLNIDTICVEELCAIETVLRTLHEQAGYTVADCITQVQGQFPYLKEGVAVFEPGSLIVYNFVCLQPLCVVNNEYLLLNDGVVVGKNTFSAYAPVPAITVDQSLMQDECQMRKVADAMVRIDRTVTAVNAIHWQNIHTGFIDAQDRSDFKVMFDVTHIPTTYILAHCTTIHHELQDAHVLSQGLWVADIRFKNQIIVYRGKGGGYG